MNIQANETKHPDPTRNDRQRKRREQLDKIAQGMGYQTWAKYETAMIKKENGKDE